MPLRGLDVRRNHNALPLTRATSLATPTRARSAGPRDDDAAEIDGNGCVQHFPIKMAESSGNIGRAGFWKSDTLQPTSSRKWHRILSRFSNLEGQLLLPAQGGVGVPDVMA